jgi:hypothetical protein
VAPFANKTDQQISLNSLRDRLISDIGAANIEALPLTAAAAPQIEAEAAQKGCDYILYTNIAELKKPSAASRIGGMFGHGAGDIVKEKYATKIDFKLNRVGNAAPQLTASADAKEEGAQDVVLSSALAREAKAIIAEVQKRH